MSDKITLLETKTLWDGWGRLTRATLDYRRTDGAVQTMTRENYDHGNAAAILLFDPTRRTVLLVRQFRYPVFANGEDGFLLEACAGLLDDDAPLDCVKREALEEAGHAPRDIVHVGETYTSPGSVQERLSLFVGHYGADTYRHAGGGLAEEGEEIELVEMTLEAALAACGSTIVDAKTIILLQHVRLQELEGV